MKTVRVKQNSKTVNLYRSTELRQSADLSNNLLLVIKKPCINKKVSKNNDMFNMVDYLVDSSENGK